MNRPIPEIEHDEAEEREKKLSDRIRNWVRFTVDRNWSSARCRSIEGRYRPPVLNEDNEEEKRAPKRTQAELDAAMRDAWEVEDAWKELPDLYRFCLQFVYLRRWKPRTVWYRLMPYRTHLLKVRNYDEVLRLARFALQNQLRRRRHR